MLGVRKPWVDRQRAKLFGQFGGYPPLGQYGGQQGQYQQQGYYDQGQNQQQGYYDQQGYYNQPGYNTNTQQSFGNDQEVIMYISERLQEPQLRIVRAVVDYLGTAVAYDLLDATERIQAQGGMIVPDTGAPRTSGGIFLQLLKQANHLPREAQNAALQRIRAEGKRVKSWEKAVPRFRDWS